MQQHAETLFMSNAYRALKLWRSAEALFAQGHTKCFTHFPLWARPDKARNYLFSWSMFACISIKWSNKNTDESIRTKDELTTSMFWKT